MSNADGRRSPVLVEILLALLVIIAGFAGWNVTHGIQRIEDKFDAQAVRINQHFVDSARVQADLAARVQTLESGWSGSK